MTGAVRERRGFRAQTVIPSAFARFSYEHIHTEIVKAVHDDSRRFAPLHARRDFARIPRRRAAGRFARGASGIWRARDRANRRKWP